MKNLELWNKVEKTNPKYTKKANVKGNNITSIAPQFQIMNATEHFGVYGQSWGFRSLDFDYSLKEHGLVSLKALFFFPNGEFTIINSISIWRDNAQTKIDDNFAKKLETDALTKALSKLGFNADIFLGKFDDVRYVDEMDIQFGNKEAPKKQKLSPKAQATAFNRIEKGELALIKRLKDTFDLTVEQIVKLDSYGNS